MQCAARSTVRPTVAARSSRCSVVVRAQKPSVAQSFAVVFAAAALMIAPAVITAPAQAATDVTDKVRPILCASNPTSKICTAGSAARQAAGTQK